MANVTETLVNAAGEPLVGHKVTAHLIVVGYDLTAASRRTVMSSQVKAETKTDAAGTWTLNLVPNADIESPDNTYYVVERRGGKVTILVTADGGELADLLIDPPDDIDESAMAVRTALLTEALNSRVGALLGPVTLDGSTLVATLDSPWGITAGGAPYYDADGAADGEEALLHVTDAGGWALIQPEGTL